MATAENESGDNVVWPANCWHLLNSRDGNLGEGTFKSRSCFPPLNLFVQALLNMLMKLAISDVCGPRWWRGRTAGQMAGGAGGKRLIFNRRPELCHDVLMYPNRLLESIPPPQNEWMHSTMTHCTLMKQHLLHTLSKGLPLLLVKLSQAGIQELNGI